MAEQVIKNPNSIKNLFKEKFSTKLNVIYVNSLKREVNFREVSVAEQKKLSKTIIENETRRDIVYDTQCAIINQLCLEANPEQFRQEAKASVADALDVELQNQKDLVAGSSEYQRFCSNFQKKYIEDYVKSHTFDIYNMTEFDRMRILMQLYQNNYDLNKVSFKCKECGAENEYELDFQEIIDKLNEFDLTDQTYTVEDSNFIYNFTINYPTVRSVSQFYKEYARKYKGASNKEIQALDDLGSLEYINLYIRKVELIDKENKDDKTVVDFSLLSYAEFEELLASFPQNIIFNDKIGVMKYISSNFIDKVQQAFAYRKCLQCGAETSEGIGNTADFFT